MLNGSTAPAAIWLPTGAVLAGLAAAARRGPYAQRWQAAEPRALRTAAGGKHSGNFWR